MKEFFGEEVGCSADREYHRGLTSVANVSGWVVLRFRSEALTERVHMPLSATSTTIMLVEDDEGVRALVRQILVGFSYHVIEAPDGLEALEVASEYEGPIHLLLTDVIMPKLNGILLAERLSQQRPGLTVIFMSGYVEATILSAKHPSARLLQKPFSADSLARAVRMALGSED